MFATIETAIDYLSTYLSDFFATKSEIQAMYQGARENLHEAVRRQDQRAIDAASENLNSIIYRLNEHASLSSQLEPLSNALGISSGNLGLAPAVVAAIYWVGGTAAAISLAFAVYAFFQNVQLDREKFEQVRSMLRAGQITPGQAIESGALSPGSGGFFQGVSNVISSGAGLLLAGGLVLLAWKK